MSRLMLFLAMTTSVFGVAIDKRLHELATKFDAKDAAATSQKRMRVPLDAVTVQSMNPNLTRTACDDCTSGQNTGMQAETFLAGNLTTELDACTAATTGSGWASRQLRLPCPSHATSKLALRASCG